MQVKFELDNAERVSEILGIDFTGELSLLDINELIIEFINKVDSLEEKLEDTEEIIRTGIEDRFYQEDAMMEWKRDRENVL